MNSKNGQKGFTLIEVLITTVLSTIIIAAIHYMFAVNSRESVRLHSKTDLRNHMTLTLNAVGKSLTLAGFGTDRMKTIFLGKGSTTDTLITFVNPNESRVTTTIDALVGDSLLYITDTTDFKQGHWLGIADGNSQTIVQVMSLYYKSSTLGWEVGLSAPLAHGYLAGAPDVYPLDRVLFYQDSNHEKLIISRNGYQKHYGSGIQEFRAQFRDKDGVPVSTYEDMAVVTYSLSGRYYNPNYSSPDSTALKLSLTSTIIPRNRI